MTEKKKPVKKNNTTNRAVEKSGPKGGRPKYVFTQEERDYVTELAGNGVTQEDIAVLLDIDQECLRDRLMKEFRKGKALANSKVGGKLFSMAMDGNPAAAIFWAKSQMGWKETQSVEVSGPDKKEIEIKVSEARNKLFGD